jgi:isoleucyl-tRNA synthetase
MLIARSATRRASASATFTSLTPSADLVPVEEMLEIDPLGFGRDERNSKARRDAYERYDFTEVYQTLYSFSTIELSALYFDIIKDRPLHCGREIAGATIRTNSALSDRLRPDTSHCADSRFHIR